MNSERTLSDYHIYEAIKYVEVFLHVLDKIYYETPHCQRNVAKLPKRVSG